MTVHHVELMAADDVDQQNVKNKISDLKSKYGEKLPKQAAPFDYGETIDGTVSYYKGAFRVTLSDSSKITEKNDLTEQIRKEMDKSASWWQVRWSECTHDGDTRTVEKTRTLEDGTTETYAEEVKSCAWENVDKSSSADIPDEVEY